MELGGWNQWMLERPDSSELGNCDEYVFAHTWTPPRNHSVGGGDVGI